MVDGKALRGMIAALDGANDASTSDVWTFEVAGKKFAWSYRERVHPKKARAPRLDIMAVSCPTPRKELLVEAAPDRFFDDDHYRGYPAVLVRLDVVDLDELASLLADACRAQSGKA